MSDLISRQAILKHIEKQMLVLIHTIDSFSIVQIFLIQSQIRCSISFHLSSYNL